MPTVAYSSSNNMVEARGYARGMTAFVHGNPDSQPVGCEVWPDHYGVILTPADVMAYTHTAQVVYLTTSQSKISLSTKNPHLVYIDDHAGKPCVAICNQVHTVDISRLGHPENKVSGKVMAEIEDAVVDALGLNASYKRRKPKKGGA